MDKSQTQICLLLIKNMRDQLDTFERLIHAFSLTQVQAQQPVAPVRKSEPYSDQYLSEEEEKKLGELMNLEKLEEQAVQDAFSTENRG